jgi:hypothetical protein
MRRAGDDEIVRDRLWSRLRGRCRRTRSACSPSLGDPGRCLVNPSLVVLDCGGGRCQSQHVGVPARDGPSAIDGQASGARRRLNRLAAGSSRYCPTGLSWIDAHRRYPSSEERSLLPGTLTVTSNNRLDLKKALAHGLVSLGELHDRSLPRRDGRGGHAWPLPQHAHAIPDVSQETSHDGKTLHETQ